MLRPRRMNPVPIEYISLEMSTTTHDPDFGEPKIGRGKKWGAAIAVQGQIVWGEKDKKERTVTGDAGQSDGHLTFRKTDLDRDATQFQKGDIIISVAGYTVNLEVIEVRPSGHLRGHTHLIMVFFKKNENTNPALRR